ncbi:MAG TPA: cupin domain-containing protein [Dokdonella sp.]|uniref:cupin domain-containing protein n=1 Tax=Dokdonella sp. TaxID=2291710 RepID=UPI002D7E24F1|nr:cupin domain-containing protein [Dokdonella sp.]HET9033987.1 cupin domain-containing protein [Dokdonella sp.]
MIETAATSKHFLGMSAAAFLRDYWQQKPLLIRNAFANMPAPLSADDLGGLACEDYALSRLITHEPTADTWTLRNGPFAESDFAELPTSHWTLLVQDVDKWDTDVAALLERFDFLPSWRIDDVMVSYAEDGGSVGAHVDHYDVFLVQGPGRRRWQISTDPDAPKAFRDDVELKLLREFTPTHEWLLEPGDMLYLPPGIAHHGVAEGECLTFSIGMRAPAVAEMVADFSGFLAERMSEELRYSDARISPMKAAGEIDDMAIERISQTLRDSLAVDASLLRCWFGSFITRYRATHEAVPLAKPIGNGEFQRRLDGGAGLQFNPWSRFAWSKAARGASLFVAGDEFTCSRKMAARLCRGGTLSSDELIGLDARSRDLLHTLVNAGHLALSRSRRRS